MAKKMKVKALKSIGGVKVPKAIRKSPMVDALLNHPLGRVILAEALVAAAAAASAVLARTGRSGRDVKDAGETIGQAAKESASKGASAVAESIGAVVTSVARHLLSDDKPSKKSSRRRTDPDKEPHEKNSRAH